MPDESAWWLRIRIPDPDEVHFHPLGDAVDPGEVDATIAAAVAAHDVPADHIGAAGWDVAVIAGPLHRQAYDGFPGDFQRAPYPPGTFHDRPPS